MVMNIDKTITINTLDAISEIFLHDAELKEIICDYLNKILIITMKSDAPDKSGWTEKLEFRDVKEINIPFYEPWGAGYYVSEVSTNQSGENHKNSIDSNSQASNFSTKILLNSGDQISVYSSKLLYSSTLKSS